MRGNSVVVRAQGDPVAVGVPVAALMVDVAHSRGQRVTGYCDGTCAGHRLTQYDGLRPIIVIDPQGIE